MSSSSSHSSSSFSCINENEKKKNDMKYDDANYADIPSTTSSPSFSSSSSSSSSPSNIPIAIVGIGCRFPGGVSIPNHIGGSYWDYGDGVVDIPPDRYSINKYYDPNVNAPGKIYENPLHSSDPIITIFISSIMDHLECQDGKRRPWIRSSGY